MSCHSITHVNNAGLSRYFRLFVGCILFIPALWTPVCAQTAKQPLELSTAITRTLNENPALRVFAFRQQALEGNRSTAELTPGFELGFDAEDFAGTADKQDFEGAKFTLYLSSVIEMGNKREARVSVVDSRYQYLNARREVEALELLGEVTRRFVSVLAAQHRLELAKESAQLAEQARVEIEVQSNAGVVPLADLKRAEAAAAQARLTVASEEGQFTYLKVALAAMWGNHMPTFNTVDGYLFQLGDAVTFETLFARVEQNPAIQVFAAEERLRAAEQRLASTNSSTDLRWLVGVKRFHDLGDTAFTAGFSVPLFSARRNQGAAQAASAAHDEVAVQREVALTNIRKQLFNAYTHRVQAMLMVEQLQSAIIPALAAALEETQRAYQQGRYRYLDYLSTRQEWVSARRALIDAAAAALTYSAEIEQLTAQPILTANDSPDPTGISQ